MIETKNFRKVAGNPFSFNNQHYSGDIISNAISRKVGDEYEMNETPQQRPDIRNALALDKEMTDKADSKRAAKNRKKNDEAKGIAAYAEYYRRLEGEDKDTKFRVGNVIIDRNGYGAFFKLVFTDDYTFKKGEWLNIFPRNGHLEFVVMRKGLFLGI